MVMSVRISIGVKPGVVGAIDHTSAQGKGAVEFCYGAYLRDKHTHQECPFTVKKP